MDRKLKAGYVWLRVYDRFEAVNFNSTVYLLASDDDGASFQMTDARISLTGARSFLQEPGLLEMEDGSLWLWARTALGSQYQCFSQDGGESFTTLEPTIFTSPLSPMSVIRLSSTDTSRIVDLADKILGCWRAYTDEEAFIFAETDGEKHNTITPIARKRGEMFELDLVLRNNITTAEHPLGVYHPHAALHHIKKENIGLIEVMGCAILPARLKTEMADLKKAVLEGRDYRSDEVLEKHADWMDGIKEKYTDLNENNIDRIIRDEIGAVFSKVLEDAGVYKRTPQGQEAFQRFVDSVNR
jgi:hypothetical protein